MKLLWSTNIIESPMISGCEYDFIDNKNELILPCSKISRMRETYHLLRFDKSKGTYKDDIVHKLKDARRSTNLSILYEEKALCIGSKIIRSKNSYFVECIENRSQIWQIRHRGFLFTDFIERNGCVIFGTDGWGGGLYSIELNTGNVLCDLNTGGTTFYDWHNGDIVLFAKNKLLKINPFTSRIIDEHPISKKFPYHTVIKVIDDYVYGVVFTNDNQGAVLCLEL